MRIPALLLCALVACGGAFAQSYPAKPIRIVVAGSGGGEAAPRAYAQEMTQALGQPVVIDPQSAAGGSIAAQMVARAAPDGYTLLYSSPNALVYRLFLVKEIGYDTLRDFTPISRAVDTTLCIAASNAAPFSSLQGLIDWAKANPGKLSYATTGIGSGHHLNMEQIKAVAGFEYTHVPYKSGAQEVQDLIGGRVPAAGSPLSNMVPLAKSGKLRVIAIIGQNRSPLLPDVPTVREVVPGYESIEGWSAFFGPAGLPRPIVTRLHAEIAKAAQVPALRAQLEQLGYGVTSSTPEEMTETVKHDIAVAAKLAERAGIKRE